MPKPEKSWEAQQLDTDPAIRSAVERSPEFLSWRSDLTSIEIDGERFYLPWGDIPFDEDQIVYHWARSNGLLRES